MQSIHAYACLIGRFQRCHCTFQPRTSAITFHRAADARKRSPGQTTPNSHVCTIVYAGALRFHRKDCFTAQNACLVAATNIQPSRDRDGSGHRPKIVATMIAGEHRMRGTADCAFLRRRSPVHSSYLEASSPLVPPADFLGCIEKIAFARKRLPIAATNRQRSPDIAATVTVG